jgi:hemoglobin
MYHKPNPQNMRRSYTTLSRPFGAENFVPNLIKGGYLVKKAIPVSLVLTLAVFLLVPVMASAQQKPDSLYKRLGGYDAIAAVTDDFIGRLATDPSLSKFFVGHSKDSLERIRQHVVDFLCVATGGPCVYKGRDMKTSHAGLGITTANWDAGVKHLVATLDKFQVPEKEKNELLAAASGLKADIVEKP